MQPNGTELFYRSAATEIGVPICWALIVVVGVSGNGFVVYVMLRYGDRKPTTLYMINLAVADVAFSSIVIPMNMIDFITTWWTLGEAMCKIHSYMIYVIMHTSCLTLTAMTIDRYFAIVHPLSSRIRRNQTTVTVTAVAIWIMSFAVCIPSLVFTTVRNYKCTLSMPTQTAHVVFSFYVFSATYILPLIVIATTYSLILISTFRRQKKFLAVSVNVEEPTGAISPRLTATQHRRLVRLARMVALIVALFAFCWLPIHAVNIFFITHNNAPVFNETWFRVKIVALTLEYANSCVNPFVYAFMGDSFRLAARHCLPRRFRARFHEESQRHIPLATQEPRSTPCYTTNDNVEARPDSNKHSNRLMI